MDRLEAMSILLLTVEKGSLTGAARQLRMPLPTVSRKISELEAHLGTRLLLRTTRRLALTDAGTAYVAAARRVLEDVEEAERIAAGEYEAPRGELVLTAPVFFGRLHILPIVAEFLGLYPDIHVRLLLSDRNLHLVEDHVDMAVRIGALPDSSLIATKVGTMRTVVCASPALLAAHGDPAQPQDPIALPCITLEAWPGSSVWAFRQQGKPGLRELSVTPRLSVTTTEAAVSAAVLGVGVARVLHYQCAAEVAAGSLRILLAEHERDPVPVSLVHAARGALPIKMRMFLDFAAERLRRALAMLEGEAR